MSTELSIINLHESNTPAHPLPHNFLPDPQKCFRMLIFSPSNSGKSNLIKNLITRNEFGYTSYYKNNIFIFSPTIKIDPIWQSVELPKTHLYDDWDEKIVENIMAYSTKQGGVLLVLDDMITSSQKTFLSRTPPQNFNHSCQSKAERYSAGHANQCNPCHML
jgi:hypothetical protein